MPKLLDFVKEKGISHADAMKLIEDNFIKPDDENDSSDAPDTEDEQIEKPDSETEGFDELDEEAKAKIEKLADEEEVKIEAKAKIDKAKIAEYVQEVLKKRGKIKRKTPSKGKITDVPKLDYDINVKGYEVKSIRRKKD